LLLQEIAGTISAFPDSSGLAPLAYSIFQLSIIIAKKVSFASPYLYSKWQNKYNPGFTRAKK
jgi:hypothetical protein